MPVKINKSAPLTPDQVEQARAMQQSGVAFREIARRLACTRHHLERVLHPEKYARKLERERYYFIGWKTQKVLGRQTSIGIIPDAVLADRERRLSAERTPNNIILGDPLPGQSALDRRASQ